MVDRLDGSPIDHSQGPVRLDPQVTAYLRPRTVTPLYRAVSPTQDAVRLTIERFGMATSSQLRRLHYQGTDRGVRVRSADHLLKLTKRGVIRRMPYKLNGEYVYTSVDSKARIANLHQLDVTELFVRLKVLDSVGLEFDPEPWATKSLGGYRLTPDAYLKLPTAHYLIEVDRGSESPSVISAKMNRYVRAFEGNAVSEDDEPVRFPQVVWLAHDVDRVRTLQREADKKEPGLFVVCLFSEAIGVMTSENADDRRTNGTT
jgi:hypothetical protein